MAELDGKKVGLAAKDIVVGIAAAVVGAYAPAGADGVRDAGKGIDTLVGELAPSEEDKKKSRSREFEAQDFKPRSDSKPATADGQTTRTFLQSLGWDATEIDKIMKGPTRAQAATPADSAPADVPAVDGKALQTVIGKVLPMVTGKAIPTVEGTAVKPSDVKKSGSETT
jgi:hypothetical protein